MNIFEQWWRWLFPVDDPNVVVVNQPGVRSKRSAHGGGFSMLRISGAGVRSRKKALGGALVRG